ncbi:MAG TPA: gluconokinase [Anaerolineae bacterium]|nr:gluconokinase [Anaerolineae bacterium]
MTLAYIIMGVSGCGKTAVGTTLATHLNAPFYDADDYHPPANIAKMSAGIPLTDQDRLPWLHQLHTLLAQHIVKGETAVLACSALKQNYRQILRAHQTHQTHFVYLHGSFDLIWQRLTTRQNHYMKADMLHSQFATLEPPTPTEAQLIPITLPINQIVAQIISNTT